MYALCSDPSGYSQSIDELRTPGTSCSSFGTCRTRICAKLRWAISGLIWQFYLRVRFMFDSLTNNWSEHTWLDFSPDRGKLDNWHIGHGVAVRNEVKVTSQPCQPHSVERDGLAPRNRPANNDLHSQNRRLTTWDLTFRRPLLDSIC